MANFQESVCSLEFAARAHGVELGKAKANVENMEVPKLQEQLKKVKDQLHEKDSKLRDLVSLKRKFKLIEEENNCLKSKISSMVDTNAMSKVSEKTLRMEKDLRDREDKLQQQKSKIENYQSQLCKAEQRVEQLNGKEWNIRTVGNKWSYLQASKFNINAQPFYVMIDHNGEALGQGVGYDPDPQKFIDFLEENFARFEAGK